MQAQPYHPYLIISIERTLWHNHSSVMIAILVPLALVLYDYLSFLSDYHSAPSLDPRLLHHCSLVLAEYFSFAARVFAHCRCFLVDYWSLREEDLCTQGAAVTRVLLAQHW